MRFRDYATVINDLHLFAPHAIHLFHFKTAVEEVNAIIEEYAANPFVVLNGDIIDLANCKYSELGIAEKCVLKLEDAFGNRYVKGNHERMYGFPNYFAIINNTLFRHGNWEMWSESRNYIYLCKKNGAGRIKRSGVYMLDKLRHLKPWNTLNENADSRIEWQLTEKNCNKMILGHSHCRKNIEGRNYTVLKRGIQEVMI